MCVCVCLWYKIEEMCGGIMHPITEMGCKYGEDSLMCHRSISCETAVQGLNGSQAHIQVNDRQIKTGLHSTVQELYFYFYFLSEIK